MCLPKGMTGTAEQVEEITRSIETETAMSITLIPVAAETVSVVPTRKYSSLKTCCLGREDRTRISRPNRVGEGQRDVGRADV